ncbi:MAG TPA: ABC transporter permease [Candidatus Binatus sp.]|jgi:predicted permease|nr:ABC transporter permease [Candidatus Binatus sp.]
METLLQDIRYSIRMLAKNPGFAAVAVLTLALGIGANTAIFSVVNAVLLRPLAYRDSASLVNVWGKFDKEHLPRNWISEPEYWDLRDRNQSFSDLGAYSLAGSSNLTSSETPPVQVSTPSATASLFSLLGVQTELGRTFLPDEDLPGRDHAAILSFALWQSQFGHDPKIVERSIQLDGESYSIVGVLRKDFSLGGKRDLWLPLSLDRAHPGSRGSHLYHVVARLKPGITLAQAGSDIERFALELQREYPDFYGTEDKGWGMFLVPMKEQLVGDLRPALLILLVSVAFVLLIACVNVANLLLAQASAREKELAVRAAMGAGRVRLIRQLLTESLVLALLGGLFGLFIAYWGVDALRLLIPDNVPRIGEIQVDHVVLAFTFGVSLLTGLIFGLFPAWHVGRADLQDTLKEAGRGSSAAGGSRRLRGVLVISEVAFAVLLLVGAGLLIRSFSHLLDVRPGFQTDHLLTMELSLPEKAYPDGPPVEEFYKQLLDRLRVIPGVQAAGAISELPLSQAYSSGSVLAEESSASDLPHMANMNNLPYLETDRRTITPGYFAAMEIPLQRGRLFSDSDTTSAPFVAIVDTDFAHRFWPGQDPIGKRIAIDLVPDSKPETPRWRTVVGVVGHVKHYGLDTEGREQAYFPQTQKSNERAMYLAVRAPMDPSRVTSAIRQQVSAMDKNLPLYNISTMDQLLSNSVAQPRLNLTLLVAFAGLALLLAAVGVYGVMAFAVAQRTHEFGIRVALGAHPEVVLKQLLIEGGKLAALGLCIGLITSLALTRLMASLLFNVKPSDPVTFLVVAAILAGVALLACYIPARRAMRVDPMVALRYE